MESFLFRIDSLAKEFQKRYLFKLETAYKKNKLIFPGKIAASGSQKVIGAMIHNLSVTKWIAYAKQPFAGPEQVLEYLGRYTHRVAISNNRLVAIDDGQVTFTYRDRASNNEKKVMSLESDEFIRRFLLHVLPKGFMKIRYYGFLSNIKKKQCIILIRQLIEPMSEQPDLVTETLQQIMQRITGIDITCCPQCQKRKMIKIRALPKPVWNTS
ncbi:MAG: hypothetical protein GY702_10600 [Desulfobulbaceae bacterium]|nr:hypothetical protein [Desulfobulbaceae bacterium]